MGSPEPPARRPRVTGRGRLTGALAFVVMLGPGILGMLGENDGPSMLSYAATGAQFGAGFFLPFVVVTFGAAVFVEGVAMRLGTLSRRGFGELIFERFGASWGWMSIGDLTMINFTTLITEVVAIRVGMAYFGIPAWVAAVGAVSLVVVSSSTRSFRRWEALAIGLGVVNLIFVAAAVEAHVSAGAVGRALVTW